MSTDTIPSSAASSPTSTATATFTLGKFTFSRDEYFAHVTLAHRHAT